MSHGIDHILRVLGGKLGINQVNPTQTLHVGGGLAVDGPGLVLPTGSVSTSMLATGAAQALIGSYLAAPTWSTTTVGSWQATPVTTGSITCSGATLRIEAGTSPYHSVVGAGVYTGLMVDGVALYAMTFYNPAAVNYTVPCTWTIYYTPAPGAHTFTLMVYNATAGTLALNAAANSYIYTTEQRR